MAMTSSDANAISAVVVRDIVPVLRRSKTRPSDAAQLLLGRVSTFCFLLLSMCLALMASHFGGVIGLLILWYGALVGPIAIPMLLGLLYAFRKSGPLAAFGCWITGAVTFGLLKFFPSEHWLAHPQYASAIMVGVPMLVSFVTYTAIGLIAPWQRPESDRFLQSLRGGHTLTQIDATPAAPQGAERQPTA